MISRGFSVTPIVKDNFFFASFFNQFVSEDVKDLISKVRLTAFTPSNTIPFALLFGIAFLSLLPY